MNRPTVVIGLRGRRLAKLQAAQVMALAQLWALIVEEQETRGPWALDLKVAAVVTRGLLLWARLRR